MRRVDGSVRVDMKTRLFTAGRLGFEDSSQRCGGVLSKESSGRDAAIVRDDDMPSIFVKHVDSDLIKQITVLPIDKGIWPLVCNRFRRQNENVFQLLNRNLDSRSLPRSETPTFLPFRSAADLIGESGSTMMRLVGRRLAG